MSGAHLDRIHSILFSCDNINRPPTFQCLLSFSECKNLKDLKGQTGKFAEHFINLWEILLTVSVMSLLCRLRTSAKYNTTFFLHSLAPLLFDIEGLTINSQSQLEEATMYIYLKLKFQFVLECQSSDKSRQGGKWIINSCVGQERTASASNNSFLIYPGPIILGLLFPVDFPIASSQNDSKSELVGWITFVCPREVSQKSIQLFRWHLSKWCNKLQGLLNWSGSILGPILGWLIIFLLHFKVMFWSPKRN